jgi:hypothetical protein
LYKRGVLLFKFESVTLLVDNLYAKSVVKATKSRAASTPKLICIAGENKSVERL